MKREIILGLGAETRISDAIVAEERPAWSPAGNKIAFASDAGDDRDIYVIDVKSGSLARLTTSSGWDGHPAWTPR